MNYFVKIRKEGIIPNFCSLRLFIYMNIFKRKIIRIMIVLRYAYFNSIEEDEERINGG